MSFRRSQRMDGKRWLSEAAMSSSNIQPSLGASPFLIRSATSLLAPSKVSRSSQVSN